MALSKLAVRRLTKLVDFMQELPPESKKKFNMSDMVFHGCGTSACAAGWAETIPSFKRGGYTYWNGDIYLGIDMNQWSHLFSEELALRIRTPKQWAAHCRKFIKANS